MTHTDNRKPKIHEQVDDPKKIEFGKHFSDHMLLIDWTKDGGWESPRITPFQDLSLSPGLSALHYATEVGGVVGVGGRGEGCGSVGGRGVGVTAVGVWGVGGSMGVWGCGCGGEGCGDVGVG